MPGPTLDYGRPESSKSRSVGVMAYLRATIFAILIVAMVFVALALIVVAMMEFMDGNEPQWLAILLLVVDLFISLLAGMWIFRECIQPAERPEVTEPSHRV